MSEVFLSYRQTDDAQLKRVRAFGERLRDAGITVILDQFLLDDNPGGPNDGWPKWSSDKALQTQFVLIIGTPEWFQCFEKTQPPGTGLGAACEADDLRTRIFEANGVIENIRVVLFDHADAAHIPGKLRPYHRFQAERDLTNIVRWLGGKPIIDTPRTSIPHNLPSLQPFFGREEELKTIADALLPESRTWGALIDGPGGIGKTSLAVRAAYDTADAFEKIAFVSLKSRELDDDGVRDLSSFLISGLAELLNELARELGHAEITKAIEVQRPRMLLDVLRGTRTLLVLDNLESLLKTERDIVFTLVKKLPPGCKAILTSRVRIGSAAEEVILEELGKVAALNTLETLAERNPALAKTDETERLNLYIETGGNPLLLRWTAGQIGRGSCFTASDAIAYLRSNPKGNDPLEFIFGDLVEGFSAAETNVLYALTYFSLPAKVQHVADIAKHSVPDVDHALRSLVNRSLVVATEELKTFTLIPLVADFLRNKKTDVVTETGNQLEKRAYTLVVENGYENYQRFSLLDLSWPTVAAALPLFLAGPNDQLQRVCDALTHFLNFTGRYDEAFALNKDAETRAVLAADFFKAGWRAHDVGWIHFLRGQSAEVQSCADRVDAHWQKANVGTRERIIAKRLRGTSCRLAQNHSKAILVCREAVELARTLGSQTKTLADSLNELATAERYSGDFTASERDYREALRIARAMDYTEAVAYMTGNLAAVAMEQGDWVRAEALEREALSLSEIVCRPQFVALDCQGLATALVRQGKKREALQYAQRAVDIFTRLGLPDLAAARDTLAECEN